MIISRITGGLGNQLFQFAAAYTVAQRNQVPLKLHFSMDSRDTQREPEINRIVSKLQWCSKEELNGLIPHTGVERLLQRLLPISKRTFIKERHFHFDNQILKTGETAYLQGYWQSEKYFTETAQDIRSIISKGLSKYSLPNSLESKLSDGQTVSLHVRKGDYLKPPFSSYYHQLNSSYYASAIAALEKAIPSMKLFVFTDDPNWVNKYLDIGRPYQLISTQETFSAIEDMHAMMKCNHHIIANSSFSWWSAWLCDHPKKIVVAPSKWFNEGPSDTADLIPEGWLTL